VRAVPPLKVMTQNNIAHANARAKAARSDGRPHKRFLSIIPSPHVVLFYPLRLEL